MREGSGSWLLPDDADRARMLDMDRRLRPIRRAALAVLAGALLVMGPWVGWWTLAPLIVAGLLFYFADRSIESSERPEFRIFAAWVGAQCMIGFSVLLAWAPDVPVLSWFAIPIVTLSARFSIHGILAGVGITIALMLGVAFGAHGEAIVDQPPLLVMPLAVVLAVAILSTALMRSDVQHRSEAVIDPLTGMLNRKAMENRAEEIRQQAEVTGASLAVVMIDIDHFKAVNDTVGHATGDAVLRDVAYIMRRDLRAFELAYRLGGEEFLVMLPGTNQEEAMSIAERLREAIAENSFVGEIQITVSCGVAASREGAGIDFQALLESADRALYEAKRTGRNRSVTARGLELVAA